MSQIKLLHSGGNGVVIAAPDSNPASDRTLKLPSNADGTVLTTTNPKTGNIIQVVHTIKSNGFSVSASTDNFSDVTGLSASITPASSSNKILIHFQTSYSANVGQRGSFRLLRDSTVINAANADGQNTNQTIFPALVIRDNTSMSIPVAGSFLDNPSTTSAVTYKLQVGAESGAGTIFVNADASTSTGSTQYKGVSNLILMEVAG
tara:strand:+ start:705 stop:1319 length:615 start_codon:yes stop_codon:yes gene_type:complete